MKKLAEKKELKSLDHSLINYKPYRKDFYIECQEITNMTEEEVEKYRKELGDITIRGKNPTRPIKNWY